MCPQARPRYASTATPRRCEPAVRLCDLLPLDLWRRVLIGLDSADWAAFRAACEVGQRWRCNLMPVSSVHQGQSLLTMAMVQAKAMEKAKTKAKTR